MEDRQYSCGFDAIWHDRLYAAVRAEIRIDCANLGCMRMNPEITAAAFEHPCVVNTALKG